MSDEQDAARSEASRQLEKARVAFHKMSRAETVASFTSWLAALVGAAGVAVSISFFDKPEQGDEPIPADVMVVGRLAEQSQRLRQDVDALRKAQQQLISLPPDAKVSAQLATLASKLEAIEARQVRIEQVILNNPAKALEVPLLRRDIEAIRESNTQGLTAVRQTVDQIYDLTKWLLGGLAVGVLSLAVGNFFTKRQ